MDSMEEQNGWLFPSGLDIPEQAWYRMKFGNRTVHDLDKHGHMYLARQRGYELFETEIVDSGQDDSGIRWAAAETKITIDGVDYRAVGGADVASDQVRDPEHTHTVAATRSLKNAVKLALGIRPASEETQNMSRESSGDIPVDDSVDGPDRDRDIPEPAAPPADDDGGTQKKTLGETEGDAEW